MEEMFQNALSSLYMEYDKNNIARVLENRLIHWYKRISATITKVVVCIENNHLLGKLFNS